MKLIGLKDLPDNFRVGLEEDFREELFRKSIEKIGEVKELAKILKCCENTILNLRKGASFIKASILKELSKITQTSFEKIELHINELKTRNKKRRIKVKFPIYASKELASLVGHCIGDGSLTNRQFSYFNTCKQLVDEVKNEVNIAFSTNIIPTEFEKDRGLEIEFPTSIARLLLLAGAPIGNKLLNEIRVPNWIIEGSKEIKVAFIKALFDDEGWIKIKWNRRSKNTQRLIGINMAKKETLLKGHERFLEDGRKLLMEFKIKPSKISNMGKTKNGISLGFTISNFQNLENYFKTINFSHPSKEQKLLKSLTSYKNFNFKFEKNKYI